MDQSEKDTVDFESGIDTWVIDKEDSNGSLVSVDKGQSLQLNTMNKENVKDFTASQDSKSLRFFRIRKRVAYQELSSDSESDSVRKEPNDKDGGGRNKKIRSESLHTSIEKPKTKPHLSTTSSVIISNQNQQDKTSLNNDEISIILSGIDEKSEGNQEKREKLHSIENVSTISDTSEKSTNHLLKINFICSVCNLEYHNFNDLQRHSTVHKIPSFSATSNKMVESPSTQNNQDQSKQKLPNAFVPSKDKSDFIGTFKTHLLSNGLVVSSKESDPMSNVCDTYKVKRGKRKIYRCTLCNYYSSKMFKFKTHEILFHTDTTDLQCEYCNYKTTNCVNLATHMKDHLLDCSHCNYQCLGSASLDTHMKTYHVYFKCHKCDFNCDSRRTFSQHLKRHLAIDKFKCEHCKSAFSLKLQLKNHIEKHCVQSKPYKCDKCDKCFAQKCDLKFHLRSHREWFVCDICKREFANKSFLRLHLQWHNKESFKCLKCKSNFLEKHHLKLHMLTHKSDDCSSITNDTSKQNICIDKLYNVQKRSLNFMRENCEIDSEVSRIVNEETERHVTLKKKSSVSPIQKDNIKRPKCLNITDKSENRAKVENAKRTSGKNIKSLRNSHVLKKLKTSLSEKQILLNNSIEVNKNNVKLRSLRQNVSSHTNPQAVSKKKKRKRGKTANVISKKIRNRNTTLKTKGDTTVLVRKTNSKKSSLIVKSNKSTKVKKSNQMKRFRLRNYYPLKDLDCMKTIFSKKTSLKNLLVDPIGFVSGNFVECYYQSQPTSTPPLEHMERHLRQRSLLSCRLCQYKTNSQQLLQRHTAETHTWERAVVNTLFS